MSTKEWYLFLLEKNVTMREIDQEGRTELIPCRMEKNTLRYSGLKVLGLAGCLASAQPAKLPVSNLSINYYLAGRKSTT